MRPRENLVGESLILKIALGISRGRERCCPEGTTTRNICFAARAHQLRKHFMYVCMYIYNILPPKTRIQLLIKRIKGN